jgi:hypothetical protein
MAPNSGPGYDAAKRITSVHVYPSGGSYPEDPCQLVTYGYDFGTYGLGRLTSTVVAIEIPCRTCGGRYEVSLKKIALSQQMLHEGCPVRAETECPPLFLAGFVDRELTQDLQRIWSLLEKEARGVNGEVKLHSA